MWRVKQFFFMIFHPFKWKEQKRREKLIVKALSTPAGRQELAKAMIEGLPEQWEVPRGI